MNSARSWPLFVVTVFCAVSLAAGKARANRSHMAVTLEYSSVEGCPDVNYFKAVVVERLGMDAFVDGAPKHVIVRVNTDGLTFEGNIEWLDASGNWAGERTFPSRSRDCEDLVRAMAFTLALQLQLSAITDVPPSESPPVGPARSAETAPTTTHPNSAPDKATIEKRAPPVVIDETPPTHHQRPLLGVGAGTLLGFGMSSSAVPFVRVFGEAVWPHGSLELAGELGMPTTIRRSDGSGFSHREMLASAAGCGTVQPWSACLVVKAGTVRIAGKDIDAPNTAGGAILETGFRAKASQQIFQRAYVSVYAEALVRPILWAVTLDQTVVWRSPRFAEALGIDVSLRFK